MAAPAARGAGVPPAAAAVAVGLPVLVGHVSALWALGGQEGPAIAVAYRLLPLWFAIPPALVLAVLAAVAGLRGARRRAQVAVGLLVLGTVAVTLVGGVVEEDLRYPVVRALVYLLVGLPVAVAQGARVPGAAAGLSFGLLVGAGEMSGRALAELFLLAALAAAPHLDPLLFVRTSFFLVLDPMWPWHLAAVGGGLLVTAVAVGPTLRSWGWLGLLWILVILQLLLVGGPQVAHLADL